MATKHLVLLIELRPGSDERIDRIGALMVHRHDQGAETSLRCPSARVRSIEVSDSRRFFQRADLGACFGEHIDHFGIPEHRCVEKS